MTTDYASAVDSIFSKFITEWQASSQAIAGYVPEFRWQGLQESAKPDPSKFWCRVSQNTVDESQASLCNDVAKSGNRRFEAVGLVFVQLFCPRSDVQAMEKGRLLAQVAKKIFRGQTPAGTVWFRNSRINELANENEWLRFNVIAEYKYSELG